MYIFIEDVTFSVYFFDALEHVKYLAKYFACLVAALIAIKQCDFVTDHLCIFFPSIPLALSLMDWLLHRVPSDPWKKPIQCHLKGAESRVHRIVE